MHAPWQAAGKRLALVQQQIKTWLAYRRAPSADTASAFVPPCRSSPRYPSHSYSNSPAIPDEWEAFDRYASHSDCESESDSPPRLPHRDSHYDYAEEQDGVAGHTNGHRHGPHRLGHGEALTRHDHSARLLDSRMLEEHSPRPPGGLLYLKHFFPEREGRRPDKERERDHVDAVAGSAFGAFGQAYTPLAPSHAPRAQPVTRPDGTPPPSDHHPAQRPHMCP
jgi:hypothetical protein